MSKKCVWLFIDLLYLKLKQSGQQKLLNGSCVSKKCVWLFGDLLYLKLKKVKGLKISHKLYHLPVLLITGSYYNLARTVEVSCVVLYK